MKSKRIRLFHKWRPVFVKIDQVVRIIGYGLFAFMIVARTQLALADDILVTEINLNQDSSISTLTAGDLNLH